MRILPLFLLAITCLGCTGAMAAKAVNGKAFVATGSIFGTSLYNCEYVSSQAVCYEVSEQELVAR